MKKIFSTYAKKVAFLIFIFSNLLWGSNAHAVENIKPNSVGSWIVDGFEISMDITCGISRSDFFPEKYCSQPSVVIRRFYDSERELNSYLSNTLYFKLEAGDVELGDKWAFDGNNDPQRKVSMSDITLGNVRSEELFKLLMSKPDSFPIKFMTKAGQDSPIKSKVIILSGFKSYAGEQIKQVNYQYATQEYEDRRSFIFGLILLAVFFGLVVMLIRFFIRRVRRKIDNVKQHIETRRVSRVAEDEAIREVVRQSVQRVDDESLAVLRGQVKTSLDAGDTKTAEELLKILNGLTK